MLILTILLGIFTLALGCEESKTEKLTGIDARRAKLVGNENLRLRKQIDTLKDQIQEQKDLVIQCEKQQAINNTQSGELHSRLLQTFVDYEKNISLLQQENAELKSETVA